MPLWGRQIPYTMMKFACFERTVEALYKFVVPKPRSECSKGEQLIVTVIAGYIGLCHLFVNYGSVISERHSYNRGTRCENKIIRSVGSLSAVLAKEGYGFKS